MNKRHLLLAVALLVSGWLAFFGDKTPVNDVVESGVAEPVARTAPPASPPPAPRTAQSVAPAHVAEADSEPAILALQPRETLIGGAHGGKPEGLFASHSWTRPPPPPPPPLPPPPPTAPALPFIYLGKKSEGGIWEVYLARSDRTLIIHEQTVIDGTYRVESIKPPTLSLTYLPLNQVQTLNIGGAD